MIKGGLVTGEQWNCAVRVLARSKGDDAAALFPSRSDWSRTSTRRQRRRDGLRVDRMEKTNCAGCSHCGRMQWTPSTVTVPVVPLCGCASSLTVTPCPLSRAVRRSALLSVALVLLHRRQR